MYKKLERNVLKDIDTWTRTLINDHVNGVAFSP